MQREGAIRFSVIVPVYNVQNYLAACIGSVARQPGPPDWECILVDDGSTDACPRMCDILAAEIPGVVALHQPNGGLAAARNTGIAAARGEWLLFLDSDDRMAPGLLPKLRGELAAHPEADWFVGRYLEYWEDEDAARAPGGLDFRPGLFCAQAYADRVARLYDAAHWSVWKYCLRRSLLQRSGVTFWPEVRWAEDWPFDLALLLHCDTLYFTDTVFTVYRVARAGSLLTSTANLPLRFDSLEAARKRIQTLPAAPEERDEMLHRLADVFWSQARTAAVPDKAVRSACAPKIDALRPIYGYGREYKARRDWRLFRQLLRCTNAKLTLWAAARLKRGR